MGFIYFSSWFCCPLRFQNSPRPASDRVSWCLETSLFRTPSRDGSLSLFCLSFYLLYFVLPPFEDNGLLFWVADGLCQCSEFVLWSLLRVQMFFQWICGGESGLPVLFLCHLCLTPLPPTRHLLQPSKVLLCLRQESDSLGYLFLNE